VAHPAPRYNYWLGGKGFAADRASGDRRGRRPDHPPGALENRRFLGRTVHHLAAEAGVSQFLDIGTGIPTADNTEVAQRSTRMPGWYTSTTTRSCSSTPGLLSNSTAKGKIPHDADLRDPARSWTIGARRPWTFPGRSR
jgi:hypothetical protein